MSPFPNPKRSWSIPRSWSILLQTVSGASRSFLIFLFISSTAYGIFDTNNNSLSDFWENQYSSTAANLSPLTDPDGDGWNNATEAIAGTNPFDANSPNGYVLSDLTFTPATELTPAINTVTWPTKIGKLYSLHYSSSLTPDSWNLVEAPLDQYGYPSFDSPRLADGSPMGQGMSLTQPDGSLPEKLFYRLKIEDADSDGDRLTNAEEHSFGSNPQSRYSDTDLLTDYQEAKYGTSPTDADSDNDGTPDHNEIDVDGKPGPAAPQNAAESKYAPELKWVSAGRRVIYNYIYSTTMPSLGTTSLWRTWQPNSTIHENTNTAIPFTEIITRLRTGSGFEFPNVEIPPHAALPYSQFSASNVDFIRGDLHLGHSEVQIKLVGTEIAETPITKKLMMINYKNEFDGLGGFKIQDITSQDFTIAAGQRISPPKVIGDDFIPTDGARKHSDFRLPEFKKEGDEEKGWDDTNGELWAAVNVGESVTVRLITGYPESSPDHNRWTQAARDLLEIAVADGSGSYISLASNELEDRDNTFTIRGLAENGFGIVRVNLRLKADHSVIFATMKVRVFEKQVVPIGIFRIYDSRVTDSIIPNGSAPTNAEIIEALNDTYGKQGNIAFEAALGSTDHDLRRHPTSPPGTPDDEQLFTPETTAATIDGRFDFNAGIEKARARMLSRFPQILPKLNLFIVRNLTGTHYGVTRTPSSVSPQIYPTCAVRSGVPIEVYCHEVGHALRLSTKAVGPTNSHDLGLWPAKFVQDGKQGLMYPYSNEKQGRWIRQEDWIEANDRAKILK
jgi:hypothetical protein